MHQLGWCMTNFNQGYQIKIIPKETKRTLLLLSTLTMMSNVAIITSLPHLKEVFSDVENIEFLSRLMITAPSLAIAFLAAFLGHLVFKIGKKKSAMIGLFLFSFFGTAGLYLNNIYELLASRFLLGIAIAILMIVNTSLIGDYFKNEERHKYMGLQSAFISIGGITFIIVGGILSDINWRYPFFIYVLGLLVLLFAYKNLIEVSTQHATQESDEYLNHNLWYIYLLAFFLMLVFYILPIQMPFLLMNEFQASGTLTGQIIAFAFMFNALGAMSFAKLKRKLKFHQLYILGMGIISLGFVLIGFVADVKLFFLTSSIMGFGGGILMANMTAWMLHVSHHTKRVKSSSYLTSALFFGQFASPIVTHPFVEYFGIHHFFVASGIFVLGCIVIAGIILKVKERL